jgi:hypothetical protein
MTRNAQVRYQRDVAKSVWDKINQRGFPRTRCTIVIVRLILLMHDTDCNMLDGQMVLFKHKNLGAGVHEVWMEAKP